jgi:hypothetical protein
VQGAMEPHTGEESTWEREEELRHNFQVSFLIHLNLGDKVHSKGGRFVTPYFCKRINSRKLFK